VSTLEINKKILKSMQRIGMKRFFTGIFFLVAGLLWKFLYVSGNNNSEINFRKILSFWPLFWFCLLALGLLWWVFSGFRLVIASFFIFAGGAFLAETMMPGVVINAENGPYFIILIGLFIFALPRKNNYQTSAYSYGNKKPVDKSKTKSKAPKVPSISLAEQKRNHAQL